MQIRSSTYLPKRPSNKFEMHIKSEHHQFWSYIASEAKILYVADKRSSRTPIASRPTPQNAQLEQRNFNRSTTPTTRYPIPRAGVTTIKPALTTASQAPMKKRTIQTLKRSLGRRNQRAAAHFHGRLLVLAGRIPPRKSTCPMSSLEVCLRRC